MNVSQEKQTRSRALIYIFSASSITLFLCSSLRHFLLQSTALDLGVFDQSIYLISQRQPPISTFGYYHILGDQAAFIYYLLALPYIIFPNVYWLFLIQSLALSCGVFPTYYLSIEAGLKKRQSIAVSFAYLLYPAIFNANLFDFHSETIAIPLILWMVLSARLNKLLYFCICLLLILSCKAVLSLTIISTGIWLLIFEKHRLYGSIALISGTLWFIISTQFIVPHFSGAEVVAVGRYSYLGDSVFGIITTLISQPQKIYPIFFSWENLGYLVLLFAPVAWGLSTASLTSLIGALPSIALNLLTDYPAQKDLVHQYSLPILPFLILGIIASLAVNKGLLKKPRKIVIWSIIVFLCLAKFTHFSGRYLDAIDNLRETHTAIALVESDGGVYTTAQIAPHLSHRSLIRLTNRSTAEDLNPFDYILLNTRHPGWASDVNFAEWIIKRANEDDAFELVYNQNDVFLFNRYE